MPNVKMHSLKQTYKEWSEPAAPSNKDEYYPCLYLDESSLDAMDIDAPKVGQEMQMVCTVRVSSYSANANGSRSMSMEILSAALPEKKEDAAKILFPNG
jgi:hypothetical protein